MNKRKIGLAIAKALVFVVIAFYGTMFAISYAMARATRAMFIVWELWVLFLILVANEELNRLAKNNNKEG